MSVVTLEQFQKALGEVDFFYQYLDDFSQWKKASEHFDKVEQLSKTNPEFKKLFDLRNPFNNINKSN